MKRDLQKGLHSCGTLQPQAKLLVSLWQYCGYIKFERGYVRLRLKRYQTNLSQKGDREGERRAKGGEGRETVRQETEEGKGNMMRVWKGADKDTLFERGQENDFRSIRISEEASHALDDNYSVIGIKQPQHFVRIRIL